MQIPLSYFTAPVNVDDVNLIHLQTLDPDGLHSDDLAHDVSGALDDDDVAGGGGGALGRAAQGALGRAGVAVKGVLFL